jgi:hypothetical protein
VPRAKPRDRFAWLSRDLGLGDGKRPATPKESPDFSEPLNPSLGRGQHAKQSRQAILGGEQEPSQRLDRGTHGLEFRSVGLRGLPGHGHVASGFVAFRGDLPESPPHPFYLRSRVARRLLGIVPLPAGTFKLPHELFDGALGFSKAPSGRLGVGLRLPKPRLPLVGLPTCRVQVVEHPLQGLGIPLPGHLGHSSPLVSGPDQLGGPGISVRQPTLPLGGPLLGPLQTAVELLPRQ